MSKTGKRAPLTRRRRIVRWALRVSAGGILLAIIGFAAAWYVWPFPEDRLERWPISPVVTDRDGGLLLRVVGGDEQWRMPVPLERISPWLRDATVAVEDQRFFAHGGVDALAVVRAVGSNLAAWRTVSGASTLTMQVCRMMDDRPRTLSAKVVEAFRALQLEQRRSKRDILELYLNVAPYGGNLRGAEAAARTYFGKSAADLSLGEAALLAGLPQSPTRYRPDRNPEAAQVRRAHVLERMIASGFITAEQAELANAEPVIQSIASIMHSDRLSTDSALSTHRSSLITSAPHAAWLALQRRPNGGRTTIAPDVQANVNRVVWQHQSKLPAGSQIAAVVIDIEASEIVALVGAGNADSPIDGQVNGVMARRSPGSALKPFIYAAAFEAGRLNADATVYDVPIERAGWSPTNFDGEFAGPLSAGEALRRSLNVPAILVAEGTGLARCIGLVSAAGVTLPADTQSRGGLAVVVGSVEVTLLDLTNAYATLGRGGIRQSPRLFSDEPSQSARVISREVCASLDDILSSHRRPPAGMEARPQQDIPWFMWKTGTSSGRRDAWAVGHNQRFAVGVWVGRFSGAGSPEFVGLQAAEPILAEIFDLPALRQRAAPATPAPILVTFPLPPPVESAGPLRILSPSNGASFVAFRSEGAVVSARANRSDLTWFLNGQLLSDEAVPDRLLLPAGSYELRCVSRDGQSTRVRFAVTSPPTLSQAAAR